MGVTIHYRLGQKKNAVESTLNAVERMIKDMKPLAEKMDLPLEVIRENKYSLIINLDNCESLVFNFMSVKAIKEKAKNGYSYENETIKNLEEGYSVTEYPHNEQYYASGFCKTQFATKIIAHKWICDMISAVAFRCFFVEVSDEGDYYHTRNIENAEQSIESNGAMIDNMTGMLIGKGYKVVKGGESTIKSKRK